MKIDITKKYKTVSGEDVVIYRVHAEGTCTYPVHGAIGLRSASWTSSGELVLGGHDGYKLVEVKEEVV